LNHFLGARGGNCSVWQLRKKKGRKKKEKRRERIRNVKGNGHYTRSRMFRYTKVSVIILP